MHGIIQKGKNMLFGKKKEETNDTVSSGIEYLIVGLGNPGSEYETTRHNAGFMAIDNIAKQYNTDIKKIQFKGLTGRANINGHSCLLLKPQTFMNLSGQSVVAAMNFYKIPIEKVIVLFDDISLEPGKQRIRRKGSDGGHNGIKNIIYLSGKDTFPRIKIGVGAKPHLQYDLAAWVLSHFNKSEMEQLQKSVEVCPDIVSLIVDGKIDLAMNRFNS